MLVTSTVQRQVAGLFLVEDKGVHRLKGVPAPVALYRIVRVSGGHRRKGARVLTPFIGREEDLGALARASERALAGNGQFVLIVGDPGIGKSRLVEEFRGHFGETPHSWIEWSSSQLLQNTPLHPALGWARARFGGPEVAPERRLAELESVLADAKLDVAKHAALLAPLIDIPIRLERLPNLSSEEIPRKQLAAMVEWALASARVQPIVLVLEDLQWFDPTSIALVQALSERGAQAPLLILATARPEFRPPWSLRPHHKVISLAPLDETQVQRMIAELLSQRTLSADVIKRMSERAGGVPLFIEEVTRLILERGEGGGAKAIPPTLRQSLAARLDRLGSAREVAQIGAVLGRSFSYRLLRDVAVHPKTGDLGGLGGGASRGYDEDSLKLALASLVDADLLFADGVPPDGDLPLQACADQGRGLRQPFEEPPADVAQTRGRCAHRSAIGTGSDRSSFHRGERRRYGDRMVGQCWRRSSAPLGLQGGDLPPRQSHRDGGRIGTANSWQGGGRPGPFRAAAETAYRLWSRGDVVERFCRRRNERSLCARQQIRRTGGRSCSAVCRLLRRMPEELHARRTSPGARGSRSLSSRS